MVEITITGIGRNVLRPILKHSRRTFGEMGTSLDLEVYSKSNFFGYISNPQKSYATFFLGGTDNIILVQLILIIQQFTKKSFLSLFLNYSLKFTQARCHQVPCVIFPLCPILRCYCTPENGMMDVLIDLSSGMDVNSRHHYFLYTCLQIWVINCHDFRQWFYLF